MAAQPTQVRSSKPRSLVVCAALVVLALTLGIGGSAGAQSLIVTVWFLGFNTTQPPFDNVAARRAVAMAVDRVRIAEASKDLPATGIEPPGCLAHSATPRVLAYDPEKAKELLGQSGVNLEEFGSLGLWVLSLVLRSNTRRGGVDILVANLQALGLKPQLREFGNFDALERIATQPVVKMSFWGVLGFRFGCDPGTFMEELVASKGPLNYFGYKNPEVDSLIERAKATRDRQAKIALFAQAEQKALEDAVIVPVYWGR